MSIHYARIENSPRLQRLLQCLEAQPKSSDGWITTWNISQQAHICAVNSAVCELRLNGYAVDSRKSKTEENAWEYRITGWPGETAQ